MRRFASREARGQRGSPEMARIAEYANMGFRDEIGLMPAKNRPHKCPNDPGAVKNRHWGESGSPNGPKWGAETAKIAKNCEKWPKTTSLANAANGDGEVARAFPDLL